MSILDIWSNSDISEYEIIDIKYINANKLFF